jgi:peptide/nickel transport system substrate-binding protein
MYLPMAIYKWADASWAPYAAKDWAVDSTANTITVHLVDGAKWQNGDPFTSADVITTFNIRRLLNGTVWRYLSKVEAKDDTTVVFSMSNPSTVVLRYILKEYIVDKATYGPWADKVQALVDKDAKSDSDEWKALLQDFNKFLPTKINALGPYTITEEYNANGMVDVNEARIKFTKNASSFLASKAKFDVMYIYNGETPTITPLVLSKQIDYATYGFPPAAEKAFAQEGIRIIRPPTSSGPAIYLNMKIEPFDKPEVRKAIAMAINRDENATVAMGQSGKAVKYMAGFPDGMVSKWVSDPSKLNPYGYDQDAAAKLLEGIGFKKGSDGQWVTDKGKKMQFELIAPADYVDWAAAAENAAEQLTKFGIKVTYRGLDPAQNLADIQSGKFQMGIQAWGSADPHPNYSFVQDLYSLNIASPNGPGISFPMKQKTTCCGDFDFSAAIDASVKGLDAAPQKEQINQAAMAFNELLPIVPLWERYGNNPVLDGLHSCGWPKEGDPIYQNALYADNFTIIFLLDGTIYPCNQ